MYIKATNHCLIGKEHVICDLSLSASLLPLPAHTPSRNLGKLTQRRRTLSSCYWECCVCRQLGQKTYLCYLEQVYFLEFETMQDYLLMCLSTSVACNLFSDVAVSYFFMSPISGLPQGKVHSKKLLSWTDLEMNNFSNKDEKC